MVYNNGYNANTINIKKILQFFYNLLMKYTTAFCIKFATNIILLCINHNFSRVLLTALRAFKKLTILTIFLIFH